jgi:RNA polymerase sigma-70 factor (ECF subfamily)
MRSASYRKVVPIQKVSKVIDKNIILRAQRGDARAFQQIVEEYHRLLWRTARILLQDPTLTDDVLQEAWIDIWKGLPRIQNYLTIRAWLLTVVANRCRMTLRRTTLTTISLENEPDMLLLTSDIEDVLEQVTRMEISTDIRCALGKLSIEQRHVLELRYFADLELNEIALVTAQPLGTVKSRQHRALQTLRTVLQVEKERSSSYEYTHTR